MCIYIYIYIYTFICTQLFFIAADKQAAAMTDRRAGRESDMRCSKK